MPFDYGCPIELDAKALRDDGDVWTFTGYASIFGSMDLGNDIVAPGAFQKSLRDHGNPLLLWQHKQDEPPVGVIVEAREDKRGLYVRGELPKEDQFCRDRLVPQLRRRATRSMSIGYRTIKSERCKETGARVLKEIRLHEVSFVNFGMHPEAGLESIKGANDLNELAALMRKFAQEAQRASDSQADLRDAARLASSQMKLSNAIFDYDVASAQLSQHKERDGGEARELISTMQLFVAEAAKLSGRR